MRNKMGDNMIARQLQFNFITSFDEEKRQDLQLRFKKFCTLPREDYDTFVDECTEAHRQGRSWGNYLMIQKFNKWKESKQC
tara:strand:+ start:29 stop:271 length:243 start_codon:yes stop_codon:yes gene_type:complete